MSTRKKILVVGATGDVGKALVQELSGRHDVIPVGHRSGQYQVDIKDSASIRQMFESVGTVDAIVSVAGQLHFGPLNEMTAEQFRIGLNDKLLGQVDLALIGQHFLSAAGSITLTSGIVANEPIRFGVNATTVNSAIEGFVRSAAVELSSGQRINAVSPSVLQESLPKFAPYFSGFEAVPGSRVALSYVRSIEGIQTGRVYQVW
jgi:NAD(P)-dependent dehydrogenase (short-subunit alcohol dehydrogenase family)